MTDQTERIYDSLLVVRAQAGDDAAFAELVERFSPRLRYFLRKLLAPHCAVGNALRGVPVGDAEDALQDVWLDVVRHLPKLAEPQALVAWLYRIARDHAYGRLRKARRLELPLDEAQLVEAAADERDEFSPDDAARIHAALDELPPQHREVLVLRFLEEMSYEQIARVVGCQLGTVRSRIHYAKQALKESLHKP